MDRHLEIHGQAWAWSLIAADITIRREFLENLTDVIPRYIARNSVLPALHPLRNTDEGNMVLSTLNDSVWLDERGIVSIVDLPPKDPNEDDDDNEEEEDDDENDEEPAVIREPDDC